MIDSKRALHLHDHGDRHADDPSAPSWAGPMPLSGRPRLRCDDAVCVAEPGLVLSITGEVADVSIVGRRRPVVAVPLIVLTSAGESISPGDWLLIHTGLAVARISAAEAAERAALLERGAEHDQT